MRTVNERGWAKFAFLSHIHVCGTRLWWMCFVSYCLEADWPLAGVSQFSVLYPSCMYKLGLYMVNLLDTQRSD